MLSEVPWNFRLLGPKHRSNFEIHSAYNPRLEDEILPQTEDIIRAVNDIVMF